MKRTSKGNAAPITQSLIGTAWHLPDGNPGTGEAMRRELLVNDLSFLFIRGTYL
jgi:hypothetical protein